MIRDRYLSLRFYLGHSYGWKASVCAKISNFGTHAFTLEITIPIKNLKLFMLNIPYV